MTNDRRTLGEWLRANWIGLGMFAIVLYGQLWNGSGWLHARENSEQVTQQQLEELRKQIEKVDNTYVRQDVFTQVLVNINQRLASIDNKLSKERR